MQLFRCSPFLLNLASELNLWGKNLNRMVGGIHDAEENDYFAALIEHFADASLHARSCFDLAGVLPIQDGQSSLSLTVEQLVENLTGFLVSAL